MSRSSTSWIAKKRREAIYARDNYSCSYCGVDLNLQGGVLTLDHVKPREKGGRDWNNNLVTSCLSCNSTKKNMSLNSFARYMSEITGQEFKEIINRVNRRKKRKLIL